MNISVDPKDLEQKHLGEDLSFNDQESILELVVEQILGFEEAFLEFDEEDQDRFFGKKSLKLNPVLLLEGLELDVLNIAQTVFPALFEAKLLKGFKNLIIPPPKKDLF